MKDYASLRKKHTASRTIAMVMAILLIIEMCSLAMLFSRVIGFSTDSKSYVISLTEGAEKSKHSKMDLSGTGFIVPTYVADPDIYFIEPQDKINEKDFGFRTYDKNVVWTTDTEGEIFHMTYDQDKEEFTVVTSDDSKVFAPGTGDTYKFTVANTGSSALKYLVYLEAWMDAKDAEGNDLWIPLFSKFHNAEGTYFGADGTSDWHDFDYIDKTGEIRPLASGSSRDYFVDWEWPFERFDGEGLDANDTYDTMLGDLAAEGADLRAYIRIKTVAWVEDYWYIYTDVIEGKGTTTEDPDMVVQYNDETTTITATPAEGYEFIGWEIDDDDIYELISGTLSDPVVVLKPGSDIHAHARFRKVPKYWIVDADVIEGEGTAAPPVDNPVTIEQGSGDTATITATPADGWEFIGWEIDGDYTLPYGGSLTDPNLVILPNSDIHAHAKFRKVPEPKYWIVDTDVIEGEGTTSPTVDNPVKVLQNNDETVTIYANPADGWEFIGWEIDDDNIYELISGTLSDPVVVLKPGSDVHAHARFKKVPKYWIVDADVIEGEGTAAPPVDNPVTVEQGSGDTVTITATPADGWEFIGWEIDGVYDLPEGGTLSDPMLVIKPGSDVHAHARFRKIPKYWIVDTDVIEGQGSTVPTVENPAKVLQNNDETVTLMAFPDEGWEFIGWEIDDGNIYELINGTLSDPVVTIKPGSDVHAHARFRKIPKYWIVDANVIEGDGTAAPPVDNPVKVEQGSGDTATITATPADGWEFIGWEIEGDYTLPYGGSLTDPNLVILPNSDIHAHAKFKKIPEPPKYWIVDTDVIEGKGTTSPTVDNPVKVIQNNDETVTIYASPADGYEFIGWEIDGIYTLPDGGSLSDAVLVIKPGSDVHAHARFRPKATEPPTEPPTTTPTTTPTTAPTTPETTPSPSETTVAPTQPPATTVVNPTSPSPTTAPAVPQTGDFTNNLVWILTAIGAFIALVVLFFVYRKVRKREKTDS